VAARVPARSRALRSSPTSPARRQAIRTGKAVSAIARPIPVQSSASGRAPRSHTPRARQFIIVSAPTTAAARAGWGAANPLIHPHHSRRPEGPLRARESRRIRPAEAPNPISVFHRPARARPGSSSTSVCGFSRSHPSQRPLRKSARASWWIWKRASPSESQAFTCPHSTFMKLG
jgi:hypothetical protein